MKLIDWQLSINAGMVILIWMVQTIIYPAYHSISPELFKSWHGIYSGQISRIVAPLMLLQIGLAGILFLKELNGFIGIHLLLIIGTWAVTFFVSVPLHGELNRLGQHYETIDKLVSTNWYRTALWSAAFVVSVLIKLKSS
ncbi:MAG: DUF1772 domain-containing protein [Bacteroidia bacterium]